MDFDKLCSLSFLRINFLKLDSMRNTSHI